jgi:CRISPR-associated protein (TIGR02710 family)
MDGILREIEKRVSNESDRLLILEKLRIFEGSLDRKELNSIGDDLFPYEKKYMKLYGKKCNILITTVGMREAPIIFSFLALRPKKGILLHTPQSEKTADKVINDHTISSLGIKFEKVEIDEIDAARNFQILKDQVLGKVKNINDVFVDPTGGRKVMGASVATFAFFYRISMVYLHAEEKMSVPVPFSGIIKEIANPYEYYGDIELSMLKRHFEIYDFDAALELCGKLEATVSDPDLCFKLQKVAKLIEIYRDWDAFLHSTHFQGSPSKEDIAGIRLADRLENLYRKEIKRFNYTLVNEKTLEDNIEFLKQLQENWANKKNICDPFRLVDLYANACRRAEQKKFDDATARLYRCLEMCSSVELQKYGMMDPNQPDYAAFANHIGMDLATLSQRFKEAEKYDLPERPGLRAQMALLSFSSSKIPAIYKGMNKQDKNRDSVMEKRNRSILAHGTNPITAEDYKVLDSRTSSMILEVVADKEKSRDLLKKATFPELMI